ncbi:MAG: carboxypeptidase-like regulatory domain-containing protein [Ferruginibacter sp.]
MKTIYHVLILVSVAAFSFNCQKELSRHPAFSAEENIQSSPITATLQGNVLDENGQPAAGVKISAGTKTSVTNANGYFRIADAALDRNASLVVAEQAGYFKAYRSFRATKGVNQVMFKLIPKILAGTINSVTGGEATLSNGSKISLPANAVTKSGTVYGGDVKVYAVYIDPSSRDIGNTIPGSFMADDKDKNRVVLSSYGMLAVELESAAGEKLQIAAGSTAKLTTAIPSNLLSTAPALISCWYVDETTGIWKEEGTAKKSGKNYIADVKHFTYWNCDVPYPSISFSAIFKTSDGLLLNNLNVRVRIDTSSAGYAYGYTDSLGQVSGLIPANKNLVLEVLNECYGVAYSKNIGPFADNTDLGTIVIPANQSFLFTLKGKLLTCNNTPVSKGYAMVYWNNISTTVGANKNGEFSISIVSCAVAPKFEIIGIDEAAQQQGAMITILASTLLTDAGDITACGTSSTQFMNYTLDGADYTISNLYDSLIAFSGSGPGTLFNTFVQGYDALNVLSFNFTGQSQAGSYGLNDMITNNFRRIQMPIPINVTITAFPQHAGEFYEGNFSGNFKDSSALGVTHNIDCSFRIKRYF